MRVLPPPLTAQRLAEETGVSLRSLYRDIDSLRAAAGVGVSWLSPLGPLKLSYGVPIKQQPGDRIQKLQFQIGTAF